MSKGNGNKMYHEKGFSERSPLFFPHHAVSEQSRLWMAASDSGKGNRAVMARLTPDLRGGGILHALRVFYLEGQDRCLEGREGVKFLGYS